MYDENNNLTPNKSNSLENYEEFNIKNFIPFFVLGGLVVVAVLWGFLANSCIFSHKWEAATCMSPQTCSKCGKIEGAALGHDWEEATCTTPKTCAICGKTSGEPLGHNVTEWVIDTQPTCTVEGKRRGECTVCGENAEENIAKTEHKLGNWEIGKAATVSENGEKVQKCTVCGNIINRDTYYLSAQEIKSEFISKCQSYSYEEIARNPNAFTGKMAVFTGEVVQSQEEGNAYTLRVNVTKGEYGIWSDTILVSYVKSSSEEGRILEGDIITMYGTLNGTYTYTAVLGQQITVPSFIATFVELS